MSTKQTEALQLALEALEDARNELCEWSSDVNREDYNNPRLNDAITAIREALAEHPAQQGCMRCNTPKKCALYGCSPLTWPAQQPAQQEPVAYMNPDDLEKMKRFGRGSVAWATPTDFCTQPVYKSPPASKPWVGLTDEEKADLFEGTAPYYNETDYADAIEAKLREKNA